jgi:CheY-like chemotaxis protein
MVVEHRASGEPGAVPGRGAGILEGARRQAAQGGKGTESRASPDAAAPASCDAPSVPLTVLIVDDHTSFRSFARALLEAEGFDVIGEAENAESALTTAARLRPQVVLLDVHLPDRNGFEVAERLAQQVDPPAVVLVSSRDISSYRRCLAGSSARGFIPKTELSGSALSALVS